MKRVTIESPYAGDVEANVDYARDCLRDSLDRGEAPYASHLLYTQPGVLDDEKPEERRRGIEAGFAWGAAADVVAVYVDRGVSKGMAEGMLRAAEAGQAVEFRSLSWGLLSSAQVLRSGALDGLLPDLLQRVVVEVLGGTSTRYVTAAPDAVQHSCPDPGPLPWQGYGRALEEGCEEDERGFFWVGNGEYWSPVDFCPHCGEKAPRPASETRGYRKGWHYARPEPKT